MYNERNSIMCDVYCELMIEGISKDILPDFLKNNDSALKINSIQQFSNMADLEQQPQSYKNQFAALIDLPLILIKKNLI